jgi:hypothetical protein
VVIKRPSQRRMGGRLQVSQFPRTMRLIPDRPASRRRNPRVEVVRRACKFHPGFFGLHPPRSSLRQLARRTLGAGRAPGVVEPGHPPQPPEAGRHSAQNPPDFEPRASCRSSVRSGEEDAGRQVPVVAPLEWPAHRAQIVPQHRIAQSLDHLVEELVVSLSGAIPGPDRAVGITRRVCERRLRSAIAFLRMFWIERRSWRTLRPRSGERRAGRAVNRLALDDVAVLK